MSGHGASIAFVGDVHLGRNDEALADFLSFLDGLGRTVDRIVLIGDLFDVWIGSVELEQAQHRAVVERLAGLRAQGTIVRYLEGNRDYRIGKLYAGRAFDDTSDRGIVERCGDLRLFAVHGDLTNPRDRQYRAWRRISRSRVAWGLFQMLPRSRRIRFAEGLEARLRGTNLEFKREFPEAAVRAYSAPHLRSGHDAVVLGHFHVEKELLSENPDPAGRIFVLPEWKGTRRHLSVTRDGRIAFVDSAY